MPWDIGTQYAPFHGQMHSQKIPCLDKQDALGDSETTLQGIPGPKTQPGPRHVKNAEDIFFCHSISVSVFTCISINAIRC